MSYQKNLGRVKGDPGVAYIPVITTEDNQQYLSFTTSDNSQLPQSLTNPIPLSPYIYKPSLNNGHLSFTLTSLSSLLEEDDTLDLGSVIGDTGVSTIGTQIVSTLPDVENLSEEDKNTIFIVDTGDSYLDTVIYSEEENDFVYLESATRFNNYYTKNEIDANFYTQTQIRTQLGQITSQQNNILSLIGNPPEINIENDDE